MKRFGSLLLVAVLFLVVVPNAVAAYSWSLNASPPSRTGATGPYTISFSGSATLREATYSHNLSVDLLNSGNNVVSGGHKTYTGTWNGTKTLIGNVPCGQSGDYRVRVTLWRTSPLTKLGEQISAPVHMSC